MNKINGVQVVLKPMGVLSVLVAVLIPTGLVVAKRGQGGPAPSVPTLRTASAAPAQASPGGALLPTSLDSWQLDANAPAVATKELIADPTVPNMEKRIVRARVTTVDPQAYWAIQFKHMVDRPVASGTPLVLRFLARSPSKSLVHAVFLLNAGEYPKDLNTSVALTTGWKVYTLPFTTRRDYKSGDAAVLLHLGDAPGEIELAALQVYPADQVPG